MTSSAIVVRGGEQVEEFIANTEISGWDVLFAVLTLIAAWLCRRSPVGSFTASSDG
ncbi:MAG: hypothetical protein ACRD0W_12355 [Acidimicrobiales bacterium]